MNRVFNTAVFWFSLVFGVTSCTTGDWSKEEKDKLVDRCRNEGGSRSYCNCYLNAAIKAYPNPEDMEELSFEEAVELSIQCK